MTVKRAKRTTDGAAKRAPLSLKLLPAVRAQLEAEAVRNNRTLGSEMETRLIASLEGGSLTDVLRTIVREELARVAPERRRPCGRSADMLCPHFPSNGHVCVCEGMHGAGPLALALIGSAS